jgi:hypothetical protein
MLRAAHDNSEKEEGVKDEVRQEVLCPNYERVPIRAVGPISSGLVQPSSLELVAW